MSRQSKGTQRRAERRAKYEALRRPVPVDAPQPDVSETGETRPISRRNRVMTTAVVAMAVGSLSGRKW